MTGVERNRLSWLLEYAPQAASAIAITVGILVLCGWMFDLMLLKSAFSGFVAMKVNSALGFILAGISLWNTSPHVQHPLPRIVSQVCAASVLLLGLLTVGEYLSGKNFGIDQLVMQDITNLPGDIPGRMAANTAANFAALGAALLLLSRKKDGFMRTIHVLAIGPILVAAAALVSYGYDIESFVSHFFQANYDIRMIQESLGHSDLRTTMIDTHTVQSITIKQAKSQFDFDSK